MISDEMLRTAAEEVSSCVLEGLPPVEDHRFSLRFQRKMKQLLFRADHPISHALTSCAAIVLLLLTAFATLMVASPTVRAAVLEWSRKIYHGGSIYSYEGQLQVQERNEYYLSQIPEGYVLHSIEERSAGTTYCYLNTSGKSLIFSYHYGSDHTQIYYDTREHEHRTVSLGQVIADIYLSTTVNNNNQIVWIDANGNAMFCISYCGDAGELVTLAETVKIK